MTPMTFAEKIAQSGCDPHLAIPESVVTMLQRVTIDAYGLMLSTKQTNYVQAIVKSVLDSGESFAFGHGPHFTVQDACLINGTAIHGEDFDDTFEGTPVHISSIIVPVIFAIGQKNNLSSDKIIRAMAAGSELICRLALVAPTAVHRQGFHPTPVLGAFGAALTASIGMGLGDKKTASALGIVGSMASGIIEYLAEGTWTKRMHPGWAAAAGVRAAAMAKNGFLGPRTVFEGVHGVFKGFASNAIPQDFSYLESFGKRWFCEGLAFKPYACGTMTQPFVDCAIQASKAIAVDQIASIHAFVGEGTVHRLWEPLNEKRNPSSPYGAKFSVPYCIAVGLLDQKAGLQEFTEQRLASSDIKQITEKITYEVNPDDPYPTNYIGRIDIRTADGQIHSFKQQCLRGGQKEPMSDEELETKFHGNLEFAGITTNDAKTAKQQIKQLFTADSSIQKCITALGQIGGKHDYSKSI